MIGKKNQSKIFFKKAWGKGGKFKYTLFFWLEMALFFAKQGGGCKLQYSIQLRVGLNPPFLNPETNLAWYGQM